VSKLFGVCRYNRLQTTEGYSNLGRITGNYNRNLHSSVLKGYSCVSKGINNFNWEKYLKNAFLNLKGLPRQMVPERVILELQGLLMHLR
jgi:hypothetical protein